MDRLQLCETYPVVESLESGCHLAGEDHLAEALSGEPGMQFLFLMILIRKGGKTGNVLLRVMGRCLRNWNSRPGLVTGVNKASVAVNKIRMKRGQRHK